MEPAIDNISSDTDRSSPGPSQASHVNSTVTQRGSSITPSENNNDTDTENHSTTPIPLMMAPRARLASYGASQSAPALPIPILESETSRHEPEPPQNSASPIARAPTFSNLPTPTVSAHRSPPPPRRGDRRRGFIFVPRHPEPHRSLYRWTRDFLGHGNPPRRRVVRFISHTAWGFFQLVFISTFLGLTRSVWKSSDPKHLGVTEWDACPKPLGAWTIVWIFRVAIGMALILWEYQRTAALSAVVDDVERRSSETQPAIASGNVTTNTNAGTGTRPNAAPNMPLPQNRTGPTSWVYERLTNVLTLLTIIHFIATNILLYSSLNTCRKSSPHLWWLAFAIACLTYVVIIEVFLIGITVFILLPIVFVMLNLVLICLGQRPISARQIMDPSRINPETPKISQRLVDRLPLVLYIPTPPESPAPGTAKGNNDSATHTYPPASPIGVTPSQPITAPMVTPPITTNVSSSSAPAKPKRGRFTFFHRRSKNTSASSSSSGQQGTTGATWEDNWEKSEFPFVRLEGHRAACAICLMDFDEPRRRDGRPPIGVDAAGNEGNTGTSGSASANAGKVEDRDGTKVDDAADPPEAEPLRLLKCGHVFHKSCLDPWLTGVSGRCPTCQLKVEVDEPKSKSRRARRTDTNTDT